MHNPSWHACQARYRIIKPGATKYAKYSVWSCCWCKWCKKERQRNNRHPFCTAAGSLKKRQPIGCEGGVVEAMDKRVSACGKKTLDHGAKHATE
jgi:hypothetical protein